MRLGNRDPNTGHRRLAAALFYSLRSSIAEVRGSVGRRRTYTEAEMFEFMSLIAGDGGLSEREAGEVVGRRKRLSGKALSRYADTIRHARRLRLSKGDLPTEDPRLAEARASFFEVEEKRSRWIEEQREEIRVLTHTLEEAGHAVGAMSEKELLVHKNRLGALLSRATGFVEAGIEVHLDNMLARGRPAEEAAEEFQAEWDRRKLLKPIVALLNKLIRSRHVVSQHEIRQGIYSAGLGEQ